MNKLRNNQYVESATHTPEASLNIQYGAFYIAFDEFQADGGKAFMIPCFGGFGEQIYVQK